MEGLEGFLQQFANWLSINMLANTEIALSMPPRPARLSFLRPTQTPPAQSRPFMNRPNPITLPTPTATSSHVAGSGTCTAMNVGASKPTSANKVPFPPESNFSIVLFPVFATYRYGCSLHVPACFLNQKKHQSYGAILYIPTAQIESEIGCVLGRQRHQTNHQTARSRRPNQPPIANSNWIGFAICQVSSLDPFSRASLPPSARR